MVRFHEEITLALDVAGGRRHQLSTCPMLTEYSAR